ncbi:MAG TPA: DUF86 domain-containing protein [Sedimentisphaerales bacterium]|nr:DUF86 domain-containing protein [Sedimentisphaerales bacterium]HRS10610.1 DUF86 domain-containing protein [Sedimentisphaerales bacterium]HRV47166.1 DUF86 domain-containing protein [Sedimentisphaerales bacterium]
MQLEASKCLFDVADASRKIQDFTRGMTYERDSADGMVQAAVERKFEIIGEALSRPKRLDSSLLDAVPACQRIIGFRNVISHGYDIVDPELVWDAIRTHLPAIQKALENLLVE